MSNFSRYAYKGPINKRRRVPKAAEQVDDTTEKVCTENTSWPVCPWCGVNAPGNTVGLTGRDKGRCFRCAKMFGVEVKLTYTTTKLELPGETETETEQQNHEGRINQECAENGPGETETGEGDKGNEACCSREGNQD